jgi:hypothetical protein
MAAGVVTVGRRPYASGLYWENSPSGRVSQAAKEAARQPGHQAQFYAVRPGNKDERVPQFGLSQSASGHKAGMPVLAACLANQQPGSWAGAFRLREGTAVVVVRDDLIVPDGDLFFLDETEARDRLLQEIALGGLQRVYAPETWGVSGADTMPIALLLNDRTDIRLRPVAMSRSNKIAMSFALLMLVTLLGLGLYIQQKNASDEAARLAQMEALRKAQMEARKMMPDFVQAEPEYPPPERKWEKRPQPLEVISSCKAALSQVRMAVAGWQMTDIRCDEKALSVKWTRTGSFSYPPPNAAVNETGSSASLTISLPTLTPRGDESLRDPEEITRRYLAQNWPGSVKREPDDPPPPPPPNYRGPWNPPPPPWVKRSFTVTEPELPWELPVFFSDLPGVVINSLSSTSSSSSGMNRSWTIDGVIYENRR